MRKWVCLVLAALLLAGSCAMAEQKVQLPDSRFYLMLPDEMEYDGPGKPGKADFAYVSDSLGLEVLFTSADGSGLVSLSDMIPYLEDDVEKVEPVTVSGVSGTGLPHTIRREKPSDTSCGTGTKCGRSNSGIPARRPRT